MLSRAQGGEARFLNWSFDVKVEGRGVCRLLDPMASNGGSPTNTPPAAEVQPPLTVPPVAFPELPEIHLLRIWFEHSSDLRRDVKTPVPAKFGTDFTVQSVHGVPVPHSPMRGFDGVYESATVRVPEDGPYSLAFDEWTFRELPLKDPDRARDVSKYAVTTAGQIARRFDDTRDRAVADRRADTSLRWVGVSTDSDPRALRQLTDHITVALDELEAVRADLGGNRIVIGRPERYWRAFTPKLEDAESARAHLQRAEEAFQEADAVAAALEARAADRVRNPPISTQAGQIQRAIDAMREAAGRDPSPPLPDDDGRVLDAVAPWRRLRTEIERARAESRTLAAYLDYEVADAP